MLRYVVLSFVDGFRRREMIALDVADLRNSDDGLLIAVQQSETGQEWAEREVGIPRGQHPETSVV